MVERKRLADFVSRHNNKGHRIGERKRQVGVAS